ncbi:MAG: NAD(P)/FAD-dependent oxidoreductase, partial [Bacteroidota bacterium]
MKQTVAIVGGGAAALLLAAFLDESKYQVTIYEKNKSVGRKLLVAGSGGFNLTHAEPMELFVERYTPATFLQPALSHFNNNLLRQWFVNIGIPTFIGSSKRVYPLKGIKPIEVLNKILSVLERKKVSILTQHTWMGWNNTRDLLFNQNVRINADHTIFALGGASWKVTGSDGSWLPHFTARQIPTQKFKAANCAVAIKWPSAFLNQQEGKPLKNIAIQYGNKRQTGEVVITQFGLEGNAIYALSWPLQEALQKG